MNPPKVYEILPGVKSLLSVAAMNTLLGNSGQIYVASAYNVEPNPPATDTWKRIVLMPYHQNGQVPVYDDQTIPYRLNIRVDDYPPKTDNYNIDASLDALLNETFNLLNGVFLTTSEARIIMPLKQLSRSLDSIMDPRGYFFKNAVYETILGAY